MNASIKTIFDQIESPDEPTQNDGVGLLWMLLEKYTYPDRKDAAWDSLPPVLFDMQLSQGEIGELIDSAILCVKSKRMSRSAELALIKIILLFADASHAEFFFQLFFDLFDTLNEQEAFGFIASLTRFCNRIEDIRKIDPFIAKYNIIELLNRLQTFDSLRLKEAALRMMKCIDRG
jgi:hypothetical protein